MIGRTVYKYQVLKLLGEGGMGRVYLGKDTELNRTVALKFLLPFYARDEKSLARFKQEARTMASLNHPNIVTVFEVCDFEDGSFIAMEFIEGQSLEDLLKEQEVSLELIFKLAIQIGEGLNEAHNRDIIHRDVKSGNILLTPTFRVKIADFGLAKVRDASFKTSKSKTLGTLHYSSPEQIQDSDVDHRSDIFSYGIVLYEMITGRLPFRGDTEASAVYSTIHTEPEPLARYKSGISTGLQNIITKALRKDIQSRYQHIDDLLADLRTEQKNLKGKEISDIPQRQPAMTDTEKDTRKLAAIMFVDIVGYSRMMGKNEETTLKLLHTYENLVGPLVNTHDGSVLKKIGDGLFCEFTSAVSAVEAAVEIQRHLYQLEPIPPDNFELKVRIGIHVGDVVKMADDLFGDGVNIAARIESLAPPGGICITESIHSAISSHPQFEIIPLGRKKLRNISYGYKVYRIKTEYDRKKHIVINPRQSKVFDTPRENKFHFFRSGRIILYLVGIIIIAAGIWIYSSLFLPSTSDLNENTESAGKISETDVTPIQKNQLLTDDVIHFVNEMRTIQNYPQLEEWLKSSRQAGKIKFGSKKDFLNLEGKYVIIFDINQIYTVLKYSNNKYLDLFENREYVELVQFFGGKRQCWVEIIEK